MSSFKVTSGRKKESVVWDYFAYDAVLDKSTCNVIVDEDSGRKCGWNIAGKNSTNVKVHLKTAHRRIFDDVAKRDADNKLQTANKVDVCSTSAASTSSDSKQGNITSFMRKPAAWPAESAEAVRRDSKLAKFFTSTGLPRRLVEGAAFREFCHSMDPRFSVPGDGPSCIVGVVTNCAYPGFKD